MHDFYRSRTFGLGVSYLMIFAVVLWFVIMPHILIWRYQTTMLTQTIQVKQLPSAEVNYKLISVEGVTYLSYVTPAGVCLIPLVEHEDPQTESVENVKAVDL